MTMTFRVGPLSLFMLRKTVERHFPGGMKALRNRCLHVSEKDGLLMLRGTTEQAVRQTARSLAETRVPSGRLLFTMVDGLCGPHCLSPGIVVERSRNENKWPPFIWTVRPAGAYRRLGGEVVEFPLQSRPLRCEGQSPRGEVIS